MENTSAQIVGGRRRISASGRRYSSTREMVLRMVEAQASPVSTAALSEATGLHENTIRGHLEQLRTDGYVRREAHPAEGRGRPAWRWRANSQAMQNPYAGLATALADSLARSSDDPIGRARDAGRAWGDEIAATHRSEASGREAVIEAMREQGFAPHDTGDDVLLRRCPLIEAATRHPDIVCAVHQGMIDGVLAARGEEAFSRLHPFTGPSECTLELRARR